MYKITSNRSGFTLVELIIVIVVIGILAAIILVAYGNVTARAHDSAVSTTLSQIEKAMEVYKIDNGNYPNAKNSYGNNCDASGGAQYICTVADLSTAFETADGTIKKLPPDPDADTSKHIQIVTAHWGSGIMYAIYVPGYKTKPACRVISENVTPRWTKTQGYYNGFDYCS